MNNRFFASQTNEIDELFRNASLENELLPYCDETITKVRFSNWTLKEKNDYLELMLDWEQSPTISIAKWFEPELVIPNPAKLSSDEVHSILIKTIHKLYEQKIVLDFSDHLNDFDLYQLIYYKILPYPEKKMTKRTSYLHWDCSSCVDFDDSIDIWLTYYASEKDRNNWSEIHNRSLPLKLLPLYQRDIPVDPFDNEEIDL
ncbi:MAG: hypothetical protein Q4C95_06495 [Planctomycetia bacterium]|nr:hypothetical protein [Planctomycetia bacterium]